jgi:hypothetical protein
MFLFS